MCVSRRVKWTWTAACWLVSLTSTSLVELGGRVFVVVDCSNHRILLLITQLQLQRVRFDSNNSQLKLLLRDTTRLHYDALTSRLYVVHCSSSEFHPDVITVLAYDEWLTPVTADQCVNCLTLSQRKHSLMHVFLGTEYITTSETLMQYARAVILLF